MNVSGSDAKLYDAVRLDSMERANRGPLVSADEVTGVVVFYDTPESTKTITLGEHAIKIVRAAR
jgi:hypothetical protein